MNKFCAGKTAADHSNCVTQSRALSQAAGQCQFPSYLVLICGLGIDRQSHLAFIVICNRDLIAQAFFELCRIIKMTCTQIFSV